MRNCYPTPLRSDADAFQHDEQECRCPRNEALMQLTIEPATLNDANTLVAFERKVADPKIYGPPLGVQGAIKEISKNTFYFIKRGDILVATAAYQLRPDKSVCISNVAVDPKHRRQEIARTVMLFILEKCKGTSRIDLVTHPDNKDAIQLYTSLGFKVESRQENYYGDGEPRLVLVIRGQESW